MFKCSGRPENVLILVQSFHLKMNFWRRWAWYWRRLCGIMEMALDIGLRQTWVKSWLYYFLAGRHWNFRIFPWLQSKLLLVTLRAVINVSVRNVNPQPGIWPRCVLSRQSLGWGPFLLANGREEPWSRCSRPGLRHIILLNSTNSTLFCPSMTHL